ncbi:MAG: ABC transporter ATP-binding protein [Planctomycetes bacterium]|nr:ABC transporter ATP-binding protein [Planctomycetota bacterium]
MACRGVSFLPEEGLELVGVAKSFGSVTAVAEVDLRVHPGEFLTLLGPSGSGKTTILKLIAGFEVPDQGEIRLAGRDITVIPPYRRDIGMVFQHYALFPHMTVAENVAFPLRMRRLKDRTVQAKVEEALALVKLSGLDRRRPSELSGGQQQRVALARAIVFGPRLLLLDEPFGALDRKLREEMQVEMRFLQQRLRLMTVFVTHDQEEALVMSDRIAVLNAGQVEQVGTPDEIYDRPANGFVAGFIGESNLWKGVIAGVHGALARVGLDLGITVTVAVPEPPKDGSQVRLLVRPERMQLLTGTRTADNSFEARVHQMVYLGESTKYRLNLPNGHEVLARWSTPRLAGPRVGDTVRVGWDASDGRLVRWD